jgi:exosortase
MNVSRLVPSLPWFFLAGSIVVLYFPVMAKLVHDWEVDPNYSHGYFIPFIAAFMVWMRKHELAERPVQPTFWGLILVLAGLGQLFVAWVGSEYFLQGTSLILVLLGTVLTLWGRPRTALVLVPIVYLVFMVPLPAIIWNKVAFPLSLFASMSAAQAIDLIGLSVLREGNIITLPNITLQVVEACSGLRSLVTLLAMSALLASMAPFRAYSQWILFLAAVPVALLCNVIRLVGTAILAHNFGAGMAQGFIHDFSGWLVFVLGLGLLLLVYWVLGKIEPGK